MALQGYLWATGQDMTYPAIGVTPSGRGVIAFTLTGDSTYPRAAHAPIDAIAGVGPCAVATAGQGTEDGSPVAPHRAAAFRRGTAGVTTAWPRSTASRSGSPASTSPTPATTAPGAAGSSERPPGDTLLGTCASTPGGLGTRTALGNWATRINQITP